MAAVLLGPCQISEQYGDFYNQFHDFETSQDLIVRAEVNREPDVLWAIYGHDWYDKKN